MKEFTLPSEAQLEIMDILWQSEPLSVRQVHEVLSKRRKVGYTTILTQMQRMADAGLVRRDTSERTHTYSSIPDRAAVEKRLFGRLAKTAFGGSTIHLALRALGSEKPTPEELDELQAYIDRQQK